MINRKKVLLFNRKMVSSAPQFPQILEDGNTVAWYSSDDLSTITKDENEFVSRWNDKLSSGRDLIQDTGMMKPTWSANGVLFDGVDNHMSALFTYNQPHQIYMVVNIKQYVAYDYLFQGSTTSTRVIMSSVPDRYELVAGAVKTGNISNYIDKLFIMRALMNGVSSSLKFDDTTVIQDDVGTSNMGGFIIPSATTSRKSNILVREVILRGIADSANDEDVIYNYLKTKYSL